MLSLRPLDENNNTVPHDHPEIKNQDFLVRGVSPRHIAGGRLSKSFFNSSSDPYKGLSTDLHKLSPDKNYNNACHVGAVQFQAEIPRNDNLKVGYDPILEGPDKNLAHCQVWRYDGNGVKRITPAHTKAMCNGAIWKNEIANVEINRYS